MSQNPDPDHVTGQSPDHPRLKRKPWTKPVAEAFGVGSATLGKIMTAITESTNTGPS